MSSNLTIQKITLDKNNHPTIWLERWYANGSIEAATVKGCESWDELTEAMQDLLGILCDACILGDTWIEEGKVSGVILKPYGDDDGFQIMAQLRINGNPDYVVNFSGVFLSQERLSEVEKKLLKKVEKKAQEYLERLPEQMDLLEQVAA